MSNGGLLQKAMDQQGDGEGEVTGAVVVADVASSDNSGFMSAPMKQGAGLALVALVLSWLLASPKIQSDYAFAGLLPILIFVGSFYLVWNAMGRKQTAVIAVAYILLAASPYVAMSLSSGEITITDADLSDDSTQITLKIRESGAIFGSSVDSADVTVTYDDSTVWESTIPFAINREDGYGEYGIISLTVSEWYQGNAADDAPYIVTVDVDSSSDSMELQSNHLQRTIDDVKSATAGAMGTGGDCDSSKETCVVGVALKSWSGLDAMGDNPPGGLPHADYTVQGTMFFEGSTVAISYPTVTVVNGVAEWDSNNGEYGGGSVFVGDDGSELPMPGSVDSFELNSKYIPIEDWTISDYGCYHFTVEVTQSSPWSDDSTVSHTSYYEYTEEGEDFDTGEPTDEAWTSATNCD
ncbi:MAG: hypothetical protein NZ778_06215 [Arenicellales bacterium]|nr:hypothetical protein [Arenicellales bacterium]